MLEAPRLLRRPARWQRRAAQHRSLAELGKSAFHLDISITDETNTKAEKARYLRAIFDAMAALRGNLHEVSYVHLIDARAAAYGYGGKTQEFRHQRAGV